MSGGDTTKLFGKVLKPKNENCMKKLIYKSVYDSNVITTLMETCNYVVPINKTCTQCNVEKPFDLFPKDVNKKDGCRSSCKDCNKKYMIKYFRSHRDEINEKKRVRRQDPDVKQKEKEKYKEYYHKPEIKERYEKYRNAPEVIERMKQYRNDPTNKQRIKLKAVEDRKTRCVRNKARYQDDSDYRLKMIIRSRIQKALMRNKTNSSFAYLGCDIDFLKKWLEFRFDDYMNWDNLGTYWHIDHILPIKLFDCTNVKEQVCFHWINLQPLVGDANLEKGAKLHIHYFMNNIVNVNRFNTKYKQFLGYQTLREMLEWLKKQDFRHGNNPTDDDALASEMDNPQPSS